MKAIIVTALLGLLAGCNSQGQRDADGKILRDKHGCAFVVSPGVGDVSYLHRLPEESLPTCNLWNKGST